MTIAKKILFFGLFFSLSASNSGPEVKPHANPSSKIHTKPDEEDATRNDSYALARLLTMLTGLPEQHLYPTTFLFNTLPHLGLNAFRSFDAQRKISDVIMPSNKGASTYPIRNTLKVLRLDLLNQKLIQGVTPLAQAAPANSSGSAFEEIAYWLMFFKAPIDRLAAGQCDIKGSRAIDAYRKILGKKTRLVVGGFVSAEEELTQNEIQDLHTLIILALQHLPQLWNRFVLSLKLKKQGVLISSYSVPEDMQGKKYFIIQSPLAYVLKNISAFETMVLQALKITQNHGKLNTRLNAWMTSYQNFLQQNPETVRCGRYGLTLGSILPHLYILESDYHNLSHEDKVSVYHAMSSDIFQWNHTAINLAWPHILSFARRQLKTSTF